MKLKTSPVLEGTSEINVTESTKVERKRENKTCFIFLNFFVSCVSPYVTIVKSEITCKEV
jgi:hypothetical protein